jgi:hypothetical protein
MKMSLYELRQTIKEAVKIGASTDYLKKEKVRARVQGLIASRVAAGHIKDQVSLNKFIERAELHGEPDELLALTALKLIPFEVWTKIALR